MSKKTAKNEDINKKLARLEFINDQLISELAYIDELMHQIGFTEGLKSLKSTAKELYDEGADLDNDSKAA